MGQDRDYPDVNFSQLTQATFLNGVLVNEHAKGVLPPSPELSSLNDLQFQTVRRADEDQQSSRERPSDRPIIGAMSARTAAGKANFSSLTKPLFHLPSRILTCRCCCAVPGAIPAQTAMVSAE
ncbi:hypothetical protein DFH09DRAFT_1097524 [Mycena vulgaris]|nr:hypothetical protein DFH09DRAFT_1098099 [Mycena vulgaris]KAJ6521840.1 hypothetical protein DFH09DRAFT_1097524 [Mycena vulgaris]